MRIEQPNERGEEWRREYKRLVKIELKII